MAAGRAGGGPVHGQRRHRDRQRGHPVHPPGPARLGRRARVRRVRVRPRVRDADHHRRPAGPHRRVPAGVPGRPGRIHPRLARLQPRAGRRGADRRADRPGRLRRGHGPAGAHRNPGELRRAGPGEGAQRPGDDHVRQRRHRPGARRAAHRGECVRHGLAVDLLGQRAGGRRSAGGRGGAAAPQEPRAGPAGPAGSGPAHRGDGAACHPAGVRPRAGLAPPGPGLAWEPASSRSPASPASSGGGRPGAAIL